MSGAGKCMHTRVLIGYTRRLGGIFVDQEQYLDAGLDQPLRERISEVFIREGQLFGAIPQTSLTVDEMMELSRVGWTRHDYHDAPVITAPQSTIEWSALRERHRDQTLHAVSHRLPDGAPWLGTRQAILEELLASTWEQKEDELRILLHAFAYTSMWSQEEPEADHAIESQEIFFFYTDRMRTSAIEATRYATESPQADDPFWDMVTALRDSPT